MGGRAMQIQKVSYTAESEEVHSMVIQVSIVRKRGLSVWCGLSWLRVQTLADMTTYFSVP